MEELILLVEEHPCLWDNSGEDYKDKTKKTKAWIEITSKLIENFHDLNEKEKNNKCKYSF